ncbi:hypothetical protein DFH07DRAFT_775038 [Mycena maculata]|uniref:Uncharacterized protein n=1 Tax=Mycena maculata TaxID=230809 RepID=A0AAD7IWF4_9AGAR|nr:hypothetical protein DFH07DRAFT_775038 [Mycena maculata]
MNHLQWNHSTSSTPVPLFPDDDFTFDFDTGLPTELPFSDGFPHASCDLDSLFLHEGESAAWNPNWSGKNSLNSVTDYTSLLPSSIGFGAGLEEFLVTAVPYLALGSISASADSPPLEIRYFVRSWEEIYFALDFDFGNHRSSVHWAAEYLKSDSPALKNLISWWKEQGVLAIDPQDPHGPIVSSGSLTVNLMQHEISSSEAQTFIGWEWQKLSTLWLDEGVSSEICHFSHPIKVGSERTKVSHVECVTGLPSQFPIPSEATAFLIDVTNIPNLDSNTTVDALHKDQPKCCGAYACESLAPKFTNVERRELDPNSRDQLVEAQLRTREIQDSTRTGQVLSDMVQCPTGHHTLEISDFIDEDLFLKKAPSMKEILGGLTPSLYHLSLVSRDTKTKLINQVKSEPVNQARHENQNEKRYIYVSEREGRTAIFGIKHGIIKYIHKVRTLDCDTIFKPVVGKTNVYEINGWMPGINAEATLGRIWIKFRGSPPKQDAS